jgi:hypothetical protein
MRRQWKCIRCWFNHFNLQSHLWNEWFSGWSKSSRRESITWTHETEFMVEKRLTHLERIWKLEYHQESKSRLERDHDTKVQIQEKLWRSRFLTNLKWFHWQNVSASTQRGKIKTKRNTDTNTNTKWETETYRKTKIRNSRISTEWRNISFKMDAQSIYIKCISSITSRQIITSSFNKSFKSSSNSSDQSNQSLDT